jgi:hypothetical protein
MPQNRTPGNEMLQPVLCRILLPVETEVFPRQPRQVYPSIRQRYGLSHNTPVTFGIKLPFRKDMPHFVEASATATISDV